MKVNVSTTIDAELRKAAEQHGIHINKALELGVKIILADDLVIDYPDCELYRKMLRARDNFSEAHRELEELKNPKTAEEKEEDRKLAEKEAAAVLDFKDE